MDIDEASLAFKKSFNNDFSSERSNYREHEALCDDELFQLVKGASGRFTDDEIKNICEYLENKDLIQDYSPDELKDLITDFFNKFEKLESFQVDVSRFKAIVFFAKIPSGSELILERKIIKDLDPPNYTNISELGVDSAYVCYFYIVANILTNLRDENGSDSSIYKEYLTFFYNKCSNILFNNLRDQNFYKVENIDSLIYLLASFQDNMTSEQKNSVFRDVFTLYIHRRKFNEKLASLNSMCLWLNESIEYVKYIWGDNSKEIFRCMLISPNIFANTDSENQKSHSRERKKMVEKIIEYSFTILQYIIKYNNTNGINDIVENVLDHVFDNFQKWSKYTSDCIKTIKFICQSNEYFAVAKKSQYIEKFINCVSSISFEVCKSYDKAHYAHIFNTLSNDDATSSLLLEVFFKNPENTKVLVDMLELGEYSQSIFNSIMFFIEVTGRNTEDESMACFTQILYKYYTEMEIS